MEQKIRCDRHMGDNLKRLRLATLRTKKNVSAREMSLSIGQPPGYLYTSKVL